MRSLNDPFNWLVNFFYQAGLNMSFSSLLSSLTIVAGVLLLSWFSNLIAKVLIRKVVTRIVKRTKVTWDDVFLEHKVFTRLSHFAPALVIWYTAGWALKSNLLWLIFVHKLTHVYMLGIGTVVMMSFIDAWHEIYRTLPISRHRHIKGYVQLIKIFVIIIASLILVSVVFSKDISKILASLGAMAAVLILVFRDTLLGLVASIQLSADKMLKVGDWITIPGRHVDGVVMDITLNTVKIRNFDNTIITVPTYSLVNESFQNWKGMEEAGLRQIKRAIHIDMNSISFLDEHLKKKLSRSAYLKEYIESFDRSCPDDDPLIKARLTNLGVFRYYAELYLKKHPLVQPDQTVIVRHRAPEGTGLPLQVYLFTCHHQMVPYENLQSEIFEHLIASLDEFGLKIFQQPTGNDLLSLSKNNLIKSNINN